MTPERIAELRALVAQMSEADEWYPATIGEPEGRVWYEASGPRVSSDQAMADALGIVALRNSATALLDLAEEALRLRTDLHETGVASTRRLVDELAKNRELRQENERLRKLVDEARAVGIREGFELADEHAEISTHDGWHVTSPTVDMDVARKKVEERIVQVAGQDFVVGPGFAMATLATCGGCKVTVTARTLLDGLCRDCRKGDQ